MYRLSRQNRLICVKFGPKLSFNDVESYATSLHEDIDFDPGFSEIVDLSDVKDFELKPEDLLRLADIADPFRPGAKRAFVALTDMQIRAARMHQLLRNDAVNIRIFGSIKEAEAWIESETSRSRPHAVSQSI